MKSRRTRLTEEVTRLLSVGGVSNELSQEAAERIVDLGIRWSEAEPGDRGRVLSAGEQEVVDWYRAARRSRDFDRPVRNVRPLHDRVLVKPLAENGHHGGIVVPDIAKGTSQRGKILAVGQGRLTKAGARQALDVKVGDHILMAPYGGVDVRVNGAEYKIVSERDILGVLE